MAKIKTATLINNVTTDGKILKIKRQYMTMKTAATMQFHRASVSPLLTPGTDTK